jgi:hypothetical protein
VDDDVGGVVTVSVLDLRGIETRRFRQVQGNDTLDVEFKATIVTQCFLSDCSEIAPAVTGSFKDAFVSSIPDGLTAKINQGAIAKNVTGLTLVRVENKALSYFTFAGKITQVGASVGHGSRDTKMVSIPMFVWSFVLSLINAGII